MANLRNLILCFSLTACGTWPVLSDIPPGSRVDRAWPQLLPVSDIISDDLQNTSGVGEASADDAQRLSRRAAGLRARARILRGNARSSAEIDALRRRMSRFLSN